jgi:hypothetical protein
VQRHEPKLVARLGAKLRSNDTNYALLAPGNIANLNMPETYPYALEIAGSHSDRFLGFRGTFWPIRPKLSPKFHVIGTSAAHLMMAYASGLWLLFFYLRSWSQDSLQVASQTLNVFNSIEYSLPR